MCCSPPCLPGKLLTHGDMGSRYGSCLPKNGDGLLKYIGCPLNQGLNRMTRMLGDPMCLPGPNGNDTDSLHDQRMACMLETAKRNLQNMYAPLLLPVLSHTQVMCMPAHVATADRLGAPTGRTLL